MEAIHIDSLAVQNSIGVQSPRPSLLVNAMSNWLPLVVNLIVGFLLAPFVVARIGKADYGMWLLVVSFVGYYGLLRLSVGTGIMRYVPFYVGRKDHEAVGQIVSTGLAMFAVVGVIVWLLSMLIAGPVSRSYNGGRELAILVRVTGIAAAVECPMRIFDAALRARERWLAANIIAIANALVYAGGVVACLLLGYGVVQMSWMLVAGNMVALVFGIGVLLKLCPEIHLGMTMVKWKRLGELLAFGALAVIATMAYTMSLQNHRLIVGKLIDLPAVAVYATAALLVEKVRTIVGAPLQVCWPRFAMLHGEQAHEGVAQLFHRTTHYSAVLACGVALPLLLAGSPFIRLWMGDGFEAAGPVLIVLGVGCLVEGTLYANGSFLGGTGRQGVQAILACVEAVCGLMLSIVLSRRMGLVGVAWGFTIFVVLIRGLVISWYICRVQKISLISHFVQTSLRSWLILAVILAVGYLLDGPSHANDWLSWFGLVFLATGLYGLATYLFVLSRQDKERVWSVLQRVPARVQVFSQARKP